MANNSPTNKLRVQTNLLTATNTYDGLVVAHLQEKSFIFCWGGEKKIIYM